MARILGDALEGLPAVVERRPDEQRARDRTWSGLTQ